MADIIWDPRPLYVYAQTPKEHYAVIESRYNKFIAAVNDVNSEPVTVFNPLREKQVAELNLIREITEVLQAKKNEDVRKSQAAAEEQEKKEKEEKEKLNAGVEAEAETPAAVETEAKA